MPDEIRGAFATNPVPQNVLRLLGHHGLTRNSGAVRVLNDISPALFPDGRDTSISDDLLIDLDSWARLMAMASRYAGEYFAGAREGLPVHISTYMSAFLLGATQPHLLESFSREVYDWLDRFQDIADNPARLTDQVNSLDGEFVYTIYGLSAMDALHEEIKENPKAPYDNAVITEMFRIIDAAKHFRQTHTQAHQDYVKKATALSEDFAIFHMDKPIPPGTEYEQALDHVLDGRQDYLKSRVFPLLEEVHATRLGSTDAAREHLVRHELGTTHLALYYRPGLPDKTLAIRLLRPAFEDPNFRDRALALFRKTRKNMQTLRREVDDPEGVLPRNSVPPLSVEEKFNAEIYLECAFVMNRLAGYARRSIRDPDLPSKLTDRDMTLLDKFLITGTQRKSDDLPFANDFQAVMECAADLRNAAHAHRNPGRKFTQARDFNMPPPVNAR